MVANQRNWKLPVNSEININDSDVNLIADAIKHYTGDDIVEIIKLDTGRYRFVASGFYNVHGDPPHVSEDINHLT